jgi:glycosyltransferase involved in cell wall biosynthesis
MGGKDKKKPKYPTVTLCTPTFNRRPFIPMMLKCFEHQTYPKDKIEWLIVDDGTDKIEDLVTHIPQIKYFKYDEKMTLGKKRNLMHSFCKGDIIIYMDDDDYYPPERVSHAVEMLEKNKNYLIAGSSELHIYFRKQNKIFQCGPYKENHSTAACFAMSQRPPVLPSTHMRMYRTSLCVCHSTLFQQMPIASVPCLIPVYNKISM